MDGGQEVARRGQLATLVAIDWLGVARVATLDWGCEAACQLTSPKRVGKNTASTRGE
jgi:hypothetical protein